MIDRLKLVNVGSSEEMEQKIMNRNLKDIYDKGMEFHHYVNTAYPLTPVSLKQYEIEDENQIIKVVEKNITQSENLCLYVHIPYCASRCKFCEYVVVDNKKYPKTQHVYINALIKEIKMYKDIVKEKEIVGYDMGGGTPTFLDNENIKKITDEIKKFNFKDGVVWSIETTPSIAANDLDKIKFIKDCGYERISMGFQTLSARLLNELGRDGSSYIYEKAVKNIREAGFKQLNIDLMYGFLNQTDESFLGTIKYTITLNPEYITLYRNRYKGTSLEDESQGVTLYKVNYQYQLAYDELVKAGYAANIGKNTFSKVKNDAGTSDYLTNRVVKATPYIGFGLGAQSFVGNYLAYNLGCDNHKLEKYLSSIEKGVLPINDIAILPIEEVRAKAISVMFYFGLISLTYYKKRFKEDFLNVFKREVAFLVENKLMTIENDTLIITKYGANHLNGIIPLFYSEKSKEEMFSLSKRKVNQELGEKIYLEKYNISDYEKPSVTVDIICFDSTQSKILLIKRLAHPFVNKLSLPGGFYISSDETVENAALRELAEETNVAIIKDRLILNGIHSKTNRDPRGWIISVSYICFLTNEEEENVMSGSDAGGTQWVDLIDINNIEIAFDHKEIIAAATDIIKSLRKTNNNV